MSDHSGYTQHGTAIVDSVMSATVAAGPSGILVINRSRSGTLWVRLDGQDPFPGGPGCFAVQDVREFRPGWCRQGEDIEVRLICSEASDYSVEAF